MKFLTLLLVVMAAGCDFLAPPNFVTQRCEKQWICDGDVAFDDNEDLCVNGNDAAAVEQSKTAFEADFAADCGGVTVTCEGGAIEPVCQATCTLTQEPCADAGP